MSTTDSCCDSSAEKCDFFDFVARYVGMTIIHPGGLEATRDLAELSVSSFFLIHPVLEI